MVPMQAMMLPVFIQVALTLFLFTRVASSRAAEKRVKPEISEVAAVDSSVFSEKAQLLGNNYNSQFQMPVLFYLVVVFALLTASESFLLAGLGAVFVLTRIAHTVIHTTSNNVMHRFGAFMLGCFAVTIMWIVLAVNIFFY